MKKSTRTQDDLEMVGNMDTLANVSQGIENVAAEISDEELPEETRAPSSVPGYGSDIADEGSEVGGRKLSTRPAVAKYGKTRGAPSSTTEVVTREKGENSL